MMQIAVLLSGSNVTAAFVDDRATIAAIRRCREMLAKQIHDSSATSTLALTVLVWTFSRVSDTRVDGRFVGHHSTVLEMISSVSTPGARWQFEHNHGNLYVSAAVGQLSTKAALHWHEREQQDLRAC
eukprot:SAG31_NODE_4514_length_3175_cov_1.647594_3_plen_127_part_00